jgi:predicted TIM-barrel fold metal-dependent hydrolase
MGAIDCDVHPTCVGLRQLLPYMDELWRETVIRRGIDDLTTIAFPAINPLTSRSDWRDGSGRAATSATILGEQALDQFGSSHAILNCLYGAQAVFSEDMAAAFSRALNGWIAREWLDADPRLRASIVVPMQSAELAVDEIDRWAPDRRFVQVLLLANGEVPLGRRQM